jgi:Nucleotidyl transferase of unknown function (DUF2204)
MNIQQDFEELLRLLEEHRVEYLIVGGYAVAFHGYPRFTKDIDIYYGISSGNIKKLQTALLKFGFPSEDLPADLFETKGNIITFGVEPVRVDIINDISGVEFADAWKKKVKGTYGGVEVNFIGKLDLIKNKTSTTRLQDKADAEQLSENQ